MYVWLYVFLGSVCLVCCVFANCLTKQLAICLGVVLIFVV